MEFSWLVANPATSSPTVNRFLPFLPNHRQENPFPAMALYLFSSYVKQLDLAGDPHDVPGSGERRQPRKTQEQRVSVPLWVSVRISVGIENSSLAGWRA
jgi:hypothetical protein